MSAWCKIVAYIPVDVGIEAMTWSIHKVGIDRDTIHGEILP